MLRTLFNIQTGSFDKQSWAIRIRDKDDQPLWLVHPSRRVDIAVLPVPSRKELTIALYPLNVLANAALRIEIGMEVFILGYPFEIKLPAYPVWKRGSIASEPQLVRMMADYMLVDTASRPGMSGAPVIRRSWTNHMVQPGVVALVDTPLNKFIGGFIPAGPQPTIRTKPRLVWSGTLPSSTRSSLQTGETSEIAGRQVGLPSSVFLSQLSPTRTSSRHHVAQRRNVDRDIGRE